MPASGWSDLKHLSLYGRNNLDSSIGIDEPRRRSAGGHMDDHDIPCPDMPEDRYALREIHQFWSTLRLPPTCAGMTAISPSSPGLTTHLPAFAVLREIAGFGIVRATRGNHSRCHAPSSGRAGVCCENRGGVLMESGVRTRVKTTIPRSGGFNPPPARLRLTPLPCRQSLILQSEQSLILQSRQSLILQSRQSLILQSRQSLILQSRLTLKGGVILFVAQD